MGAGFIRGWLNLRRNSRKENMLHTSSGTDHTMVNGFFDCVNPLVHYTDFSPTPTATLTNPAIGVVSGKAIMELNLSAENRGPDQVLGKEVGTRLYVGTRQELIIVRQLYKDHCLPTELQAFWVIREILRK